MIILFEILCAPFILIFALCTFGILLLPFVVVGALLYTGAVFILTLYKDFERKRREK